MAEPRYGHLDTLASRFDDGEAWVLHRTGWVEINRISQGNAVRELTKQQFDKIFPEVPPLPPTAFRRDAQREMPGIASGTADHGAASIDVSPPVLVDAVATELAARIERSEFMERRERALLAELTPLERELVREVMANHPTLTLAETLKRLKASGM